MKRLMYVLLLLCAVSGSATAQTWPQHPIRMIVPFAAGGSADFFARLILPKMSALLGQPVVIENRPGAGGVLGDDVVAKAAPDGYTIGLTGKGSLVLAPHMMKVPYAPFEDLTYITMIARVPNVLTVNNSVGVSSLAELVAAARKSPGKLNYGSAGNGSTLHLGGELFKQVANIDIVHVPYKGVAPAINDLLGGQIQILLGNINVMIPHIKAGKIKALAVTSTRRAALLPDVPTVTEAGMPAMVGEDFYGLIGPAKLPVEILQKLAKAGAAAAEAADVVEKFGKMGAVASPTTPEEYKKLLQADSTMWAGVIKRANIRLD